MERADAKRGDLLHVMPGMNEGERRHCCAVSGPSRGCLKTVCGPDTEGRAEVHLKPRSRRNQWVIPTARRNCTRVRPSRRSYAPGSLLHRWLGRLYVLAVVIGGLAAITLALHSFRQLRRSGSSKARIEPRTAGLPDPETARQSGLLDSSREEILLTNVERVEVTYPRFGEHLGSGNVEVKATGAGLTFIGVDDPEGLAGAILEAKGAAQ